MPKSGYLNLLPLIAIGLAACSEKAGEPPVDESARPTQDGQVAGAAPRLWNNGAKRPLDAQVAHPSGVVLQLSSIQTTPAQTTIGMRVMNGREQDVDLNRFGRRNGFLLLDTGERLYLSPPPSNARVTIPAGQTFEGELVFLGRLPAAQSAVLVLNENMPTDNEYSTTPGFRIDIPLSSAASAPAA